jgi:OOP family OmpA-OmpF porin
VTLAADVLFEFDRARLTPRARSRIAEAAAEIRRLDPRSVTIEGHTDSVGTPAYNRGLSQRRADAVRQALTRALGRERPRLLATGKGESESVAANKKADGSDDPKGRARNRRVEIRIPKR